MGRPSKEHSLTPQDVVAGAIACIDAEGPTALGVSRVARHLGIKPPAIYKHVAGQAGLERAVALTLWEQYLDYCRPRLDGIEDGRDRLLQGWRLTREFAQQHPARYLVMTGFILDPKDHEAAAIIQETQQFIAQALQLHGLSDTKLIDAMRMINATINGFIGLELGANLTLGRASSDSFEVMLEALMVAVEHIRDA